MSQTFTELQGNDTLTNSRTTINNNFNALKSGFSGTEPPFAASADTHGATYFNTTDNKTYQVIKQGTSYTWGLPKENLHTSGNESFSGTLDATTGIIKVATQGVTDNSTNAANTAFVKLKVPASVGSATKPVYTNANGVITASNADVGSTSQPIYMNKGVITAITGAIANNITGNAATSTKLAATKKINGTDFDGSTNITTDNWGTARNISISDNDATNTGTAVSVNGSGNVTLKLPATIKASLSGNASSATKATQDGNGNVITSTYLPVGGTAVRATADGNGNNIVATYATKTELDKKSSFKLFHHDWFDYQLNDQSWLRADTFSWQDGTVYSDAYNHLIADYNSGTSTTETVGSYTITYVLAADGHKITTDETNVANIYNESGVAWYYVLDTANQRFKLPRENPAREELIQVVRAKGNGMTLGLTNGTETMGLGTFYSSNIDRNLSTSNSYGVNVGTAISSGTITSNKTVGVTTDPTKSGIISDMTDSTSVFKGKQYLYFYVGQFSQSATEQTAGLNTELFNDKADRDLNNLTSQAGAGLNSVGVRTVVETYKNGTSWYRIWSDGWIEQGGEAGSGNEITITFLKAFSDTNYTVVSTTIGTNGSIYAQCIKRTSKTQITFYNTLASAGMPKSWYACGY